jgi:hypothetical protein
MSVVVWLPELPPMPATIGISAASAASFSIEPSKAPTTREATKAVQRFNAEPRPAVLGARPDAGEDVLLLAQAHLAEALLLLAAPHVVEHGVDREAADHLVLGVDHGAQTRS